MTTITASTNVGIVLNPASYRNPVLVAPGVEVEQGGGYAVSVSGSAYFFTLRNEGTISGGGLRSVGVYLAPGGLITNAANAYIGGLRAIDIAGGAGTVFNNGTILAGDGLGGVYAIGDGVDFAAGGSITNGTAATIEGLLGVSITGGAGTVVNEGTIAGGYFYDRNGLPVSGQHHPGVALESGGYVANKASAAITGVTIAGSAGTVVNDGNIMAAANDAYGIFDGVGLAAGGSVTNAASASIAGPVDGVALLATGTVVNGGTITGQVGLSMSGGGSVTNMSSGTITGTTKLEGNGAFGVILHGGTIINSGTISASGSGAWAVDLSSRGSLTNAGSGLIEGSYIGVAASAVGGTLTVVNAGRIVGTGTPGISSALGSVGVYLFSAGSVTNAASGTITGALGVRLKQGGSLTNAGTITGNSGTAVYLGGTGDNLLALDPGAVFSGVVTGGTAASNRLELASAATVGTLNGFGSSFKGFGSIVVDAGARWVVGQTFGSAGLSLFNSGTVDANSSTALTFDPGTGKPLQNMASGLIEATGSGGLTIASGMISNAGTMLAANGSALSFQSGAVNSANSGGVLTGGTWEAGGSGSTLSITGGAVAKNKAMIILAGAGADFRAGDGSTFTDLNASLAGIAPVGGLELEAGALLAATHAMSDFGTIVLANGTLTSGGLALGAIGRVSGFGTIAETRNAILNGGTIEANGGTLAIAAAIDPKSTGVFQLDPSSLLQIAADQGDGDTMSFLDTGGELIIDAVRKFGLNVGSTSYTGPLVENFASGDSILLNDLAPTGLVPVFDATTGLLQISNGATNVASLMFDTTALGSGSFHIANSSGHALLTHS